MKNDFISIYSAIELKEQSAFYNYIQCFYSNQKSVLAVYEEIILASSSENESALSAIRQASTNNKNRLNALADLKKWLLEFLAIQEIRYNSFEAKFLKLEALRKRGLFDTFQQKSKELTSELEKQQDPCIRHLFWKARLSHLNYFSVPLDRLQDYQREMFDLMQDLDDFYISAKLQYSAELYNRSKVLQDEYHIILLEEILALPKDRDSHNATILTLYKAMLDLAKNHSHEAYMHLKQFLIEKPQHDALERQAILLNLLNYTARQIRTGDETIVSESFNLYQFGIKHSLFTVLGYFSTTTFLNIVNTACHLEEYPWVKNFINQHECQLSPNEKKETFQLAMARIFFEEKKYDQVIILLRDVNFNNISFELNIRLLELRAYYEMRHKYPQEFILNANNNLYFKVFRSKKIGEALQQNILNFVKMFRSLVSKENKKQLLKELEKRQKAMICYDWIKMKIEALQK
jgi:hypothetical protein